MLYIPSVDDATNRIVKAYISGDYDMLQTLRDYLQNNNVAASISGSPAEFHNAAVGLARNDFYDYAYAILEVGISRYPKDTDLLGDLLSYGLHCRPYEELEPWYNTLQGINRRFWTWRAYQFSFDYLMAKLPYADSVESENSIEAAIERIISEFKSNFNFLHDKSDCEKAYMMEYEYYAGKGDESKAKDALKTATEKLAKCAQCALKYADIHFERGDYKTTVEYAQKAIAVKEDQNSISVGYTYYILAMSLEQIARDNRALNNQASVEEIYSAYFAAYRYFDNEKGRDRLVESIKSQVEILEFDTGFSSKINYSQFS